MTATCRPTGTPPAGWATRCQLCHRWTPWRPDAAVQACDTCRGLNHEGED